MPRQASRYLVSTASVFHDENVNALWYWSMAGGLAAVGAFLSLSHQSAQCEQPMDEPPEVMQRRFSTKQGLRDPMTSYAKYAILKELKEEKEKQSHRSHEQHHMDTSVSKKVYEKLTVQATSSSPDLEMPEKPLIIDEDMTQSEAKIEEATRKAKQHSGGLKIFSGNGNMSLALEICRHLGVNLGKATVGRFADGEVNVVIHENVRGKDIYIVQPTGPPVNDNIMELLLMVSTLRRSSARRITVVIPYYGYARQDRKMQARVPISAADVARLMEAMGIDRVIAVDLHCGQIQGFFGPRVPVDNLDGGIVGLDYFGCKDLHNPVVVSPDAGGVYRAKKFKEGLEQKYDMQDLGLAMIVKQRARAGSVDQMDLVGDVKDCDCIIVDDMIDTAGTLCKAADVLVANGARRVFAFASHGLLSGPGNERIANSCMSEVVILNTIPTTPQREANEKLTELSVAPLLAQAIFNIHAKKSISALFK
jgi:ribose-phosphate pyrophosphokinase